MSTTPEASKSEFVEVAQHQNEALGFLNERLAHRVGSEFRFVTLKESVSIYKRLTLMDCHSCGLDGLEKWLSMVEEFMRCLCEPLAHTHPLSKN